MSGWTDEIPSFSSLSSLILLCLMHKQQCPELLLGSAKLCEPTVRHCRNGEQENEDSFIPPAAWDCLSSAIAPQPGGVLWWLKVSVPHLPTSALHSSFKTFPQTGCSSLLAHGSDRVQRGNMDLSLASH